jgi:oxaloacetate decarboxylase beta subunit
MNKLYELWMTTGFSDIGWQMVIMWGVVALLLYLAIVKGFEPLLLVPISLGALIANLPIHDFILQHPHGDEPGGLFYYLNQGIKLQIFPPLIFLGVGALVDFGPLIANPRTLLLGGAAQLGIFGTFLVAPLFDFDLAQSASIGVIGGADGPTSIFTASKLAPDLLGSIAVAAYSYMALVPLIQPPIMKLLTTDAERRIKMKTLRKVSQAEKLIFSAVVMSVCCTLVRDAAPLISMLFVGNLIRECKVTERLVKAAQNEIINIVTIFLGLCVGLKMGMGDGGKHLFLNPQTLGILVLGVIAFGIATAGGVLMAKIMNLFSHNKINPLIGSAGVSAVPMAARVSQDVGQKYDPTNYLLMHAMGPNVAGVIGSALAAGYFIAMFK